jgi:hypothetical protein
MYAALSAQHIFCFLARRMPLLSADVAVVAKHALCMRTGEISMSRLVTRSCRGLA